MRNYYPGIMRQDQKPSFAIIGCGKTGTALGKFLHLAGYRLAGLFSQSRSSSEQAAEVIARGQERVRIARNPSEITRIADIVFITTPDGSIAEVCNRISDKQGFAKGAVVMHCSGALPSTVLSSAKECGAFVGSMHPMQSFASHEYESNPFAGVVVSLEGEEPAVDLARRVAEDLGAVCYTIHTEAKNLYHASAVVASNYLVTLLDLASRLIREAGIADADALKVLRPLVAGTLSNIERVGIPDALTGPIARGDVKTVRNHLSEIEATLPELLPLYKSLGLHTIPVANAKGTLSASSAAELKKLLSVRP